MDCFKSYLSSIAVLIALIVFPKTTQAQEDTSYIEASAPASSSSWRWAAEMGLGLPQPLSVGAETYSQGSKTTFNENLRAYSTIGYFRWPIGASDRSLNAFSFELGTRWFPLSFPLYFSGGLGYRYLSYTADISKFTIANETLADSGSIRLSTLYFSPSVGWSFSLGGSWHLSMDVGVQLPLVASGDLFLTDSTTGRNSDNTDDLRTNSDLALRRVAAFIFPRITLARLSYSF